MPIHELFRYLETPLEIKKCLQGLKYNSIHIIVVQTKKDNIGDNFSINIADKEIIFHRLSKLNFLGENYCLEDGTSLLVEVTYRPDSYLASLSDKEIKERVSKDLQKLNFVQPEDITAIELKSFPYAYVVHDLDHQKNINLVLIYLRSMGIESCGRFAQFEYMNSDKVAENSQKLAKELNSRN
jgi:protoporphyrinogen oxidase